MAWPAAALFEPFWNRSIERYLTSMLDSGQRRSEWRYLRALPDPAELQQVLRTTADKIVKAAKVLAEE